MKKILLILFCIGLPYLLLGINARDTLNHNEPNQKKQIEEFIQHYINSASSTDSTTLEQDIHLKEQVKKFVDKSPQLWVDALISFSIRITNENVEKLNQLVNETFPLFSKNSHSQAYAKLFLAKGTLYLYSGYYFEESYRYLSQALELLDSIQDPKSVALTYSHLGALWRNLQEYDNALSCSSKSESLYKKAGYENEAYNMRLNACIIYLETGETQKIRNILNSDLAWAEEFGSNQYLEFFHVIKGHYYVLTEKLDSAILFFNKALEITERNAPKKSTRKSYILANIGEIFFKQHKYELAKQYLQNSLPYEHQTNRLNVEGQTYAMLSKIYEFNKDIPTAYNYLKHSVQLQDSSAIQEKLNRIQMAKSRDDLLHYQQQLQISKQQTEITRVRSLTIILSLTLILVIILFILLYINRKRSIKELENKRLAQQLKTEEINNRLEKMEHERAIEEKNRKIATTQLLSAEKSRVLENLLTNFQPFYSNKQISEEIWKEMKSFVSSTLRKEDEWDKSKIHFEEVHPDFFKTLKELAPNLTENELRVCAYVRIGMKTKQIANIMSINQRSVIVSRHRIKKKLQLEDDTAIDDFIRNIDTQ